MSDRGGEQGVKRGCQGGVRGVKGVTGCEESVKKMKRGYTGGVKGVVGEGFDEYGRTLGRKIV